MTNLDVSPQLQLMGSQEERQCFWVDAVIYPDCGGEDRASFFVSDIAWAMECVSRYYFGVVGSGVLFQLVWLENICLRVPIRFFHLNRGEHDGDAA